MSSRHDRAGRAPLVLGVLGWFAFIAMASKRQVVASTSTSAFAPSAAPNPALAVEPGKGRDARVPSQIPVRGWKEILLRVYSESMDDRITTVAAGITFFSLLALFPAITALVSLYGLFADPGTVRDHLFNLSFMLPAGTFQIVEDQITRITAEGSSALTYKLVIGLGIALWGANAGMKAAIDGLNIAYEETEKRSFIMLNLLSLALTISAILVVLVAIVVVTLAPAILNAMQLSGAVRATAGILRWVLMAGMLTVGLSIFYRFGPSRDNAKWRWVTWGGALAALLWIAVSLGLSAYLSSFADYNKTYGSLGAAIALMMWIWLSACAVLIGAELNAEMEHQTAVDTTVGTPTPMGTRNATMADTLA